MLTARPVLNLFNTALKTAGAKHMMATALNTVSGIAQTPAQRNEATFQNAVKAKQQLRETPVVGIPFSNKELMKPTLR